MAANKNALIRYKTIDQCLRNNNRQWTLDDLIEACSDALYEYEGKDVYVSKRTVQLDIQTMRSDKLGYNAPIEVYERKYYCYSESDYSIMNIPVTAKDVKVMNEAIQMLSQFKDFSLFKEMDGVLKRLEDSVYASQDNHRAIIHLDKNEQLKGLQYIDVLYDAIQNEKAIRLTYISFKARNANIMLVHPQLLKEFNNRWFLLASLKGKLLTLALDRIEAVKVAEEVSFDDRNLDGDTYYKDVIGVTVSENVRVMNVKFRITHKNAPYVVTKPFHSSQVLLEKTDKGVIFEIQVQHNFELERLILGFGDAIEVLEPLFLRRRIHEKLRYAVANYDKNE